MKKKILALLCMLPAFAFCQEGTFTIKGQAGHLNAPAKAFLSYREGTESKTDSVVLLKGAFLFTGKISEPQKATLILSPDGQTLKQLGRKRDRLDLYLEAKNISVSSIDSISKASITGSALNTDNQELRKILLPFEQISRKLYASDSSLPNDAHGSKTLERDVLRKITLNEQEKNKAILSFIKTHPSSLVSFYALQDYAGPMPESGDIVPVFKLLAPKIKESEAGKQYYESLLPGLKTAVGQQAPEFALPDTSGKVISLSSLKGKYVLVDFWASWCVPCRAENPVLIAAYAKYRTKGLNILGISLERTGDRKNWVKAIQEDGIGWPQVSDLKYWKSEVVADYGIKAIPMNLLLDPNGKIIAKNLRGDALEEKLAEIYK